METYDKLLPTTEVVRHLVLKYDNVKVKARRIHSLIINAEIPAERIAGRYYVRVGDLPKIAKFLNLQRKASSKPAPVHREAA